MSGSKHTKGLLFWIGPQCLSSSIGLFYLAHELFAPLDACLRMSDLIMKTILKFWLSVIHPCAPCLPGSFEGNSADWVPCPICNSAVWFSKVVLYRNCVKLSFADLFGTWAIYYELTVSHRRKSFNEHPCRHKTDLADLSVCTQIAFRIWPFPLWCWKARRMVVEFVPKRFGVRLYDDGDCSGTATSWLGSHPQQLCCWHEAVMAPVKRRSGHLTTQLTFAVRDTVNSGIGKVCLLWYPLVSFGFTSNLFFFFPNSVS